MAAAANKAAAAQEARAYFERFDRANLYHAAAHRETDWLLSEQSDAVGQLYLPISGMQSPDSAERYTLLVPHSCSKPLHLQELHQVVRELVEGIYIFNQTPCIYFEPNYDSSSTCFIPSAYHDTLVGETLLSVDYFVKSLLHGTTVPQKDKRKKITENWKKIPPNALREGFKEAGLVRMQDDEEMGEDLYVQKKQPFLRYPPKYVDSDLAYRELKPRLSTGEEYSQQKDHVSRDTFLRYLDHVSITLVFRQKCIRQYGPLFVLDPTFDVTNSVFANQKGKELCARLHTYLQKQRSFVEENLQKKKQIAHDLELLGFISFMIPFLMTLKKQNKIIDITKLVPAMSKDLLRTDRELPPILPSETSRWSPFTAKNSYTSMHGGITFHKPQQKVKDTGAEFSKIREAVRAVASSGSQDDERELKTCTIEDKSYYLLTLPIENYYSKFPLWVHATIAELKSQRSRLPTLTDSKVQELLKKPCGPRHATKMKTVNVSLQASIEKGVLPAVAALLKRCTQTRLNKPDENGKAMIHHAAVHCRANILSVLLLAGSDVNQQVLTEDQKPTQTQPIHLASLSGGLDAVCCLLRYGAQLATKDDEGWAPIHHAASHNYQSLVAHFASIDPTCIELETEDQDKATPLLLATWNGGLDTIKCLIQLDARLGATDSSNRNIVHIAALNHHIAILKYLILLDRPELQVWQVLSAMLMADTGYSEAAARCMDPLLQLFPTHYVYLLQHSAIGSLVNLLQQEEQLQHLSIQLLANISNYEKVREALVKVNAIDPLVKLLATTNDRIQACTCVVLSDLGMSADNQMAIVQAGAVPHLVELLKHESDDIQLFSCACLGILAYDNTENQSTVSRASALPNLVNLLSSPLACIQACAASTLQAIIEGNRSNQLTSLSLNIIPQLVVLLRSKEVSVHKNAARAIEAQAEDCEKAQQELLGNSACINLLKRLLKMRDLEVKVCGGCALWAIAGALISNKRAIATHMGLEVLVDMLTVHNEKLDFVCSEALGALASELHGDNQNRIATVGGVKPLVEVLTMHTSQRVCRSVIHTLAAMIMKPALVPNPKIQESIATARGIVALASIINSHGSEIVRAEAASTLAKLVLNNTENDVYLVKNTNFSYRTLFKFFASLDPMVRLQAGYCLSIMAFNNPAKQEMMQAHGKLHISTFSSFLQSDDEFFQVHAAFQIVVLSKLLDGMRDVEAVVQGLKMLVRLCSSDIEQTKVLSAEFLGSLAHCTGGIPNTIVMAGGLEPLIQHLKSGNGPVVESSCVALGYLTFNPMANRLILGIFRDDPKLYKTFKAHFGTVVVSKKFSEKWESIEKAGLPTLR